VTRQPPPGPALVALDGPAAGMHIPIPVEGLSLGRDTLPALRRDPAVSGRHAFIRWTGDGRLMIEDRGSRNGTWVNGARASDPRVIGAGDRIQLGSGTYELRIERLAADRGGITIDGGVNASWGGVGVVGDVAGGIHTGDDIDVFYDPTGLSDVSGFPRLLMVLGIFVSLAGFALFAYPIVMGIASAGDVTDPFAACSAFERGSQAWFDCTDANFGFGDFGVELVPWIPLGAGLFFGGMVLTIVARVLQKDKPRERRRGP
jgi:hypothetical protein